MKPHELSEAIAGETLDRVEQLARAHFPGWRIPGVFAGHPVGPDVRADLVFTLCFLHGCGIDRVAATDLTDAIATVLRPIDGPATHTFYSYRVAETLAEFGSFRDNPICSGWSSAEIENLAESCDSSSWATLFDRGSLPHNYAAVLARCESARQRLGLLPDPSLLERMLAETRSMLEGGGSSTRGFLDDSRSRIGRYDIYTADVYLFTEPLADSLGDVWPRGARSALELVESTADRRGHAITWGRSSGALSACLTIELGALALGTDLGRDRDLWLGLAARAFAHFGDWMNEGLVSAHQHRSPYPYRGPQRRLQMTLDVLGKLAWAARELRRVDGSAVAAEDDRIDRPRDEWIGFAESPPAGVWSHRSRDLAFVLPLVGGTLSDYLPAPRNPGVFEVPVGAPLPTGVPWIVSGGQRFAAGHRPASCRFGPGVLEVDYDSWTAVGHLEVDDETPRFAGERNVRFEVDGRRLLAREHWRFPKPPEAIALQIAEVEGRPLAVRFECEGGHATTRIDTAGLAEYRSFWSELPVVHQLDVDPATEVEVRWSVEPLLRVTAPEIDHHYHRSLYDPLAGRVVERRFSLGWVSRPERAAAALRDVDIYHLHWPEWIAGPDLAVHERFVETLRRSGVRIVWTQHNLVPHRKDADYEAIYSLWARSVDAAIHHSEWGMARMRERHAFGAHTIHRVIPHGHFGSLMGEVADIDREEAERAVGLDPCALRIGIVGAPREEKRTAMLMEAFAAAAPADWQLLVLSLGPDDRVPDDPRILALPYEHVDRDLYNHRLAAIDVLAIPIEGGDYLTTGQFADAIGLGVPVIASDWPFLGEMLGEAAIVYGSGLDDLERCLRTLDVDRVERAAAACRALQSRFSWDRLSEDFLALLEDVGTAKV